MNNALGDYIKNYREARNLSLREFAKLADVSHTHIDSIEKGNDFRTGKPVRITNETIQKLASALNVGESFLFELSIGKSPSFEQKVKPFSVPVLGTVQAGIPIEAVQDIIDYEELNPEMLEHGEEYFALQVKGDSMQPKMDAGDVVIVRKQSDVNHGDTAIVLVNGSEATIKRVLKQEAGIMLAPNNPAYETKFYSNKEIADLPVVILGKVVELRAKF